MSWFVRYDGRAERKVGFSILNSGAINTKPTAHGHLQCLCPDWRRAEKVGPKKWLVDACA